MQIRRDYFHFVNSFRDHAFDQFVGQMRQYENKTQCKEKMDHFLDLYAQWMESRNPILANEIMCLMVEIKELDPEFHFKFDNDFGGEHDEKKCA